MSKYIKTLLFRIKTSQCNPLLNTEYEQKNNEDYKKIIKSMSMIQLLEFTICLKKKCMNLSVYAKGDFYTYPYDMWENLNKILSSKLCTGAIALHFLTQKLPCSKIDLFGFDHKFSDVW